MSGPRRTSGRLKFVVTLERDEAGWIVAECPALPGCLSQGRTEREALANIREAIAGNLEVRKELGLPLFIRVAEVEVESPSS
jgi:predicted RNase H-like HicB family nuclease